MRLANFAKWIELALVLLAAGLLAIFGYRHGGQIAGTDTLYYLDTALKGSSEPFILNRYTQVFLLTLFTTVAGSPLAGTHVYSAAAFAAGFLLVYSCARYLTSTSGPANGIIAVGLFFGLPVIIGQLLAPNVDTTAMLIVLSFLAVYILAVRTSFVHPWHIVLLGLIFLLGLKTKETVLVAGLLLFGFGLGGCRRFDSRSFLRNLGYFAAGIASGPRTPPDPQHPGVREPSLWLQSRRSTGIRR